MNSLTDSPFADFFTSFQEKVDRFANIIGQEAQTKHYTLEDSGCLKSLSIFFENTQNTN